MSRRQQTFRHPRAGDTPTSTAFSIVVTGAEEINAQYPAAVTPRETQPSCPKPRAFTRPSLSVLRTELGEQEELEEAQSYDADFTDGPAQD